MVVSDDPSTLLVTLLGSCVSVCMFDPVAGVGGMNHFLLPDGDDGHGGTAMRFGVNAMEKLVNGILKAGGSLDRLQCKAFGGAAIIPSLGHIGQENSRFVLRYLAEEGLHCVSHSLGGSQARRVRFWPATGRAQQNLVHDARTVGHQEEAYSRREAEAERKWAREAGSGVELF